MNCAGCHSGANLSDNKFYNVGLYTQGQNNGDTGRMAISKKKSDFMSFKTPGLRNLITKQNTLGHNADKTLDEIIDNYSDGGTHRAEFGNIAPTIHALDLSPSEKADLKEFLLNGLLTN